MNRINYVIKFDFKNSTYFIFIHSFSPSLIHSFGGLSGLRPAETEQPHNCVGTSFRLHYNRITPDSGRPVTPAETLASARFTLAAVLLSKPAVTVSSAAP